MSMASGGKPLTHREIRVDTWLDVLGLPEYQDVFSNYQWVEELLNLTEADIRDLGVRNSAHRARIVTTLVRMKEKLTRKNKPVAASGSGGHQFTVGYNSTTPPSLLNHPDYATITNPMMYQALVPSLFSPGTPTTPAPNKHNYSVLTNYPWYHGNIIRQTAEALVKNDGDFLLRDSISQPGDFVLTSYWNGGPLHFVVNKQHVTDCAGHVRMQYQFEDELFERLPDLIHFYIAERRVISQASCALINNPVPRSTAETCPQQKTPLQKGLSKESPVYSSSTPKRKGPKRAGSQPLLSLDDDADDVASKEAVKGPHMERYSSLPSIGPNAINLPKPTAVAQTANQNTHHYRTGSEPSLLKPSRSPLPIKKVGHDKTASPGSDGDLSKPAPPKPSRVPTFKRTDNRPAVQIRNKELYEDDDGRDYTDYDQIKSWPAHLEKSPETSHKEINIRNDGTLHPNSSLYDVPRSSPHQVDSSLDSIPTKLPKRKMTLPNMKPDSAFTIASHDSDLLTPNNKPLESSASSMIKALLKDCNPHLLAQHITWLDLQLMKVIRNHDLGLGVHSGLELLTLPQGHQLRLDILERFHCMKRFVGSTILTSNKFPERAKLLHQWIQVASELAGSIGNLFGFSAVMAGLALPHVLRLKNTWLSLKHHHSDSIFIYEAKLSPLMCLLQQGGSTLPLQNITIPYVTSLIELFERDYNDITVTLPWEENSADYGLDSLLAHLDTARIITEQCGLYRVTGENVLRNFRPERDLLETFRTETHIKFLWGSKGASVNAKDRYSKFDLVLTALSEKAEPSQTTKDKESSL